MHTLRAVQVLMSHWSIATTERYLAVDDEVRRREAVRAVSDGATGVNRCPVASFANMEMDVACAYCCGNSVPRQPMPRANAVSTAVWRGCRLGADGRSITGGRVRRRVMPAVYR
jgi:hypothetical protein